MARFFRMVGIMTIVAYSLGMSPSLNLSLKVPRGLCSLPSSQLKRSITTWLMGTHSSAASTAVSQPMPRPHVPPTAKASASASDASVTIQI